MGKYVRINIFAPVEYLGTREYEELGMIFNLLLLISEKQFSEKEQL